MSLECAEMGDESLNWLVKPQSYLKSPSEWKHFTCFCVGVYQTCAKFNFCELVSLILAQFVVPRVYLDVLETAYRDRYD